MSFVYYTMTISAIMPSWWLQIYVICILHHDYICIMPSWWLQIGVICILHHDYICIMPSWQQQIGVICILPYDNRLPQCPASGCRYMSSRVVLQGAPYLFVNENVTRRGPTYSGLIPDILSRLSRRLHFRYNISLESRYGALDPVTSTWSGMVGQVIKNQQTVSTRIRPQEIVRFICVVSSPCACYY